MYQHATSIFIDEITGLSFEKKRKFGTQPAKFSKFIEIPSKSELILHRNISIFLGNQNKEIHSKIEFGMWLIQIKFYYKNKKFIQK